MGTQFFYRFLLGYSNKGGCRILKALKAELVEVKRMMASLTSMQTTAMR